MDGLLDEQNGEDAAEAESKKAAETAERDPRDDVDWTKVLECDGLDCKKVDVKKDDESDSDSDDEEIEDIVRFTIIDKINELLQISNEEYKDKKV